MGMPIITPGTGTRRQAITDIIESVALEQTALSHILNAEGTKLQTMLAAAGVTPTQLLETNQSVRDMTNAVSRLEMVLQLNLDMFSDCICTEYSTALRPQRLQLLQNKQITYKVTKKHESWRKCAVPHLYLLERCLYFLTHNTALHKEKTSCLE